MLLGQPKRLAVTLICYVSIALTLTSGSEARDYADLQRRDHDTLNRFIKKRSPQVLPTLTGASSSIVSSAASPLPPSSSLISSRSTPVVSSRTSSSSAAAPTTTSTSSASSTTSSSASSSSSRSLSSLSTPSPTLATNLPTMSLPTGGPRTFVTSSTTVAAAQPTSTNPPSSSLSRTSRTVITVLIAIAASVVGVVIVWTIIRKWKLSKSESFEDRMQPIDWQPTTVDDDGGLSVHRRASVASSFHSGSGHDVNGYGVGDGYGSADHNHGAAALGPLPDHDFTAGTTNQHIAPVGGYADLARGAGLEPQMQEAYGHGPVAYGGYNTQDAYGYPPGAGARY